MSNTKMYWYLACSSAKSDVTGSMPTDAHNERNGQQHWLSLADKEGVEIRVTHLGNSTVILLWPL